MKYLITFLILSMSYNAKANILNGLNQRRDNSSNGFSFNLFPESLISCTKLREGDDYLIQFHHVSSGNYSLFERMYSSQKDCTLEQDLLSELMESETCFSEKLELFSEQAIDLASEFEEELRNENQALLRSYESKISFLVIDNRENIFQSAISMFSSSESDSCPWSFTTHIEIEVTTTREKEYYERVFEEATF